MHRTAISEAFSNYFNVIPANSEQLRNLVYKIRYSVYCEELGFENLDDFPEGLERDGFDQHASHCLLFHKPSATYAGCVRLITANPELAEAKFPFEKACGNGLEQEALEPYIKDRNSFGEISRLAVLSAFRRRKSEKLTPEGIVDSNHTRSPSDGRSFPYIALGLYLAAASIGLSVGLESVFAMMEPRLVRRLRYFGICFRQVGEVVDYHGSRGPFHITRNELFDNLSPEMLELLKAIEKDLASAPNLGLSNSGLG